MTPTAGDFRATTAGEVGSASSGSRTEDDAGSAPADAVPSTGDDVGPQTDVGRDETSEARPSVTMVSSPGDGSCGIGTYAESLLSAFDAGEAARLEIDQEDQSVRHVLSLAVCAARSSGDVIHVQHEYGLFRRSGSRYPGVLGLVFFPVLFLLARLRGTPVVVTMHSVLRPEPREAPFRVRLYLLLFHKLLATGTSHLVFLAADCERRFLADIALDPGEYSVLPHGVNVAAAVDVPTADAKARFGLDPDDPVVMIPGFVRPPKGHDVFVDVARALPAYQFFVAGGARPKGEDFEFADRIAAEAPSNVHISGVLDDEDFLVALNAADLAFLPYRVVTQSGTFNWCAASELPVLASDEPYFERLRREWGAVETVDVEDRTACVEAIRRILSSPSRRGQLRENVQQYRAANDFRRVAEDHARIYRQVRDGTGSGVVERAPARDESGHSDYLNPACSAQRDPAD